MGIYSQRAHKKSIDEEDDQKGDDRADIHSAEAVGRYELANGSQQRLCKLIEYDLELIEGRDLDPGKHNSDEQHKDVHPQDKMQDHGHST